MYTLFPYTPLFRSPCSLGARLHDPPKSRRGRSPDLRSAALLELAAAAAGTRRVALGRFRAAQRHARGEHGAAVVLQVGQHARQRGAALHALGPAQRLCRVGWVLAPHLSAATLVVPVLARGHHRLPALPRHPPTPP